jgi:HSP20 family protein
MYQTDEELVIQSPIAGIKSEDLSLYLEGDVLFIEGERKKPTEEKGDYFLQECYWGKFSRKIVLPVEINPDKISATFRDGILTIRIQKISKERKRKILIKS